MDPNMSAGGVSGRWSQDGDFSSIEDVTDQSPGEEGDSLDEGLAAMDHTDDDAFMNEDVDEEAGEDEEEEEDDDDEDDDDDLDDVVDELGLHAQTQDILSALRARARLGFDARFSHLTADLRSSDEDAQLRALSQLSSLFLSGVPLLGVARSVVSALVRLLESPSGSPEVLLTATRTCSQLADSGLPGAIKMLVEAGIVPALVVRFRDVGYIDVVEQAVSILQRVAAEAPHPVLEGQVLEPCLECLEFFNWHIQKAILGSVTHICQSVSSPEDLPKACSLAPLLVQYASSPNQALSELACASLCSLISAISRRSTDTANDLAECLKAWPSLVVQLHHQSPLLSKSLRALTHLVPYTKENISHMSTLISESLVGSASTPEAVFAALLHCPKESLYAALKLLAALLPAPCTTFDYAGPYRSITSQELRMSEAELIEFTPPAVTTAIRIYGTSVDFSVRQLSLMVLMKLSWSAPPSALASTPEIVPFLSSVIAQYDNPLLVVGALDIAFDLTRRVPQLLPSLALEVGPEVSSLNPSKESPKGMVLMTDDQRPVISYLAYQLSLHLATSQLTHESERLKQAVAALKTNPETVLESLGSILQNHSAPDIVISGLLDALVELDVYTLAKLHAPDFQALIATANDVLARAERLPVVASSASSVVPTLQQALMKSIKLRIRPRNTGETMQVESRTMSASLFTNSITQNLANSLWGTSGWSVSVQAIASLEVLEEFVRHRHTQGITAELADLADSINSMRPRSDSTIIFYRNGKRLHSDMSVLAAVYNPSKTEQVLPRSLWTDTFDIEYETRSARTASTSGSTRRNSSNSLRAQSSNTTNDITGMSAPDRSASLELSNDLLIDSNERRLSNGSNLESLEPNEDIEDEDENAVAEDDEVEVQDEQDEQDEQDVVVVQESSHEQLSNASIHPEIEESSEGYIGISDLPGSALLKKLAEANELKSLAAWSSFISPKLAAKLSRQLEDPLVVVGSVLPQWVFDGIREYPFLFPLSTRRQFVQSTSLGYARSFTRWQSSDSDDTVAGSVGRLTTQKYRISRDRLLQGVIKLLELSRGNPSMIEVEFFAEAGTGLGPTQEFFALASREFALESSMWRKTNSELGLFPAADPEDSTVQLFESLGRLVSRSFLDRRILDLRLNRAFFLLVLEYPIDPRDLLAIVDPGLSKSLASIETASDVEEYCLDFTLPGESEKELVPHGEDIAVTKHNQRDYVALVVDKTVKSGVTRQIEAFRRGFSENTPISVLYSFLPEELSIMCGGAGQNEDWSANTLWNSIKADHGYSKDSKPVQILVEILGELSNEERRAFLQFLTGSPNLPFGGFRALQPQFTVVLKHPETEGGDVDMNLPSVMTCANYLKLPSYTSKEIMKHRLIMAISEGAGGFPLS